MPPNVYWLFELFLHLSEAFNGIHPVIARLIGWLILVGFRGFWMILIGRKRCTHRRWRKFQMRISIWGRLVLEISLQRV